MTSPDGASSYWYTSTLGPPMASSRNEGRTWLENAEYAPVREPGLRRSVEPGAGGAPAAGASRAVALHPARCTTLSTAARRPGPSLTVPSEAPAGRLVYAAWRPGPLRSWPCRRRYW